MKKLFWILLIIINFFSACFLIPQQETTLVIKNESFTDLADVVWQNVSFSESLSAYVLTKGNSVSHIVDAGSGYIYLKRKTNPMVARTKELVKVSKNELKEFIFDDESEIIEINNLINSGLLGSLETTVLWFDDAEGLIQPYSTMTNVYYSPSSNRPEKKHNIYFPPNSELIFTVNLSRPAKLTFWHSAYIFSGITHVLNINNEEIQRWVESNEWDTLEFDLAAGNTTVQFKSGASGSLRLDSLMVCYTDLDNK